MLISVAIVTRCCCNFGLIACAARYLHNFFNVAAATDLVTLFYATPAEVKRLLTFLRSFAYSHVFRVTECNARCNVMRRYCLVAMVQSCNSNFCLRPRDAPAAATDLGALLRKRSHCITDTV